MPKKRKYSLEERYIRKTYSNMLWRVNNEKELVGIIEFKEPEQLLKHWYFQKEKFGMKCPYTGVEMIIPDIFKKHEKRKEGEPRRKRQYKDNNMAVDQIWPGKGYTFMNTVFCSYRFNRNKGSITPDGCQAVIDLYNQRTKMYLQNNLVLDEKQRIIESEIDTIERFIQEVTTHYTFDGDLVEDPKIWFKKLKIELEKRKEKIKNLPVVNYYA